MIEKILRQIVEGLGSKAMASAFAGVTAVFLFPVVNHYFDMVPKDDVVSVLTVIMAIVIAVIGKIWHLDIKTEGNTSTSTLLLNKLMKQLASATSETSKIHQVADAVDAAIPDEPPPEK